ncbi:MAG: hypothetical protein J1F23_06400 [Oscillospiraceae bacterium]|nr:hypothetical protein [Oscillospiraceae bacterium]
MAKEKKALTPEQAEIKAMKKKRRGERATKFWAVVLALVLTLSVVFAGKSMAEKNIEAVPGSNNNEPGQTTDDPINDNVDWDNNTDTTPGGATSTDNGSGDVQAPSGDSGTQAPSGDSGTQTPSGDSGTQTPSTTPTSVSKADAVKALNDATKKAASAGYDWSRKCYYSQPLQVSGKDTLNGIIAKVDENASIDSVVGGFLDITGDNAKTATKAKGAGMPDDMKKDKFLLKAMTLTEGDIKQYQVKDNTYKFQLNPCSNPQKDGKNALSRATNDFITHQEVVDGVADALGSFSSLLSVKSSDVQYSSIVITAVIENGTLTKLDMSYVMTVKALELRAAVVPINGSGAGTVEESYSNFKY